MDKITPPPFKHLVTILVVVAIICFGMTAMIIKGCDVPSPPVFNEQK